MGAQALPSGNSVKSAHIPEGARRPTLTVWPETMLSEGWHTLGPSVTPEQLFMPPRLWGLGPLGFAYRA